MKEKLMAELSPERYMHIVGVAETARELAVRYGEDPDRAYLAGLLHDCAKRYSGREMIAESQKRGMEPDEHERLSPGTLHAKLGEYIAREEYGVHDPAVLRAIRLHICGAPDMTKLDILVNVADYTEPGRDFADAEIIRILARESLERALLFALRGTLMVLLRKEIPLNPHTIITYNALCKKLHHTQEAVI